MPSKSEAQARLMAAVAHGWRPSRPRKRLPSREVAEEFNLADGGGKLLAKALRKWRSGGSEK